MPSTDKVAVTGLSAPTAAPLVPPVTDSAGAGAHFHVYLAAAAGAKQEQATQIVMGSGQRSRWPELIGGGSIVGSVSRLAARAGIDVHILAAREAVPG